MEDSLLQTGLQQIRNVVFVSLFYDGLSEVEAPPGKTSSYFSTILIWFIHYLYSTYILYSYVLYSD